MERTLDYLPEDCLTMKVATSEPAEAVLKLSNSTRAHVAFKVKTTSPERYLVKPNHGMIRQGCHAEIVIIIVHAKKQEILAQAASNATIRCNDKFLVQSAEIDNLLADDLDSKTSHELADAVTRLFAKKDKRDLRAKKLPVQLLLENTRTGNPLPGKVRLALNNSEASLSSPMPGTPEAMFAEIVTLRKKYDDLVAFTVNLTAERDSLSADLASSRSSLLLQAQSLDEQSSAAATETFSLQAKAIGAYSHAYVFSLCLVSCLVGWCASRSTHTA